MPLKHTVEELVLKNGARGLIVYVPDATVVNYQFNFRAGNQYVQNIEKQQTAHLMEHMVFNATKSIASAEEFSRQFTKNGAYHNAATYQKDMTYFSDAAFMEWDRILDLQIMAITEPLFTEKILIREKRNVREELKGYGNNYPRKLWMQLNKSMGGKLLTDTEKITTIDAVELNDVISHHKLTHTTANMRFCFVGDFASHKDEIVDKLEKISLPRGEELPLIPAQLHSAAPQKITRSDASTNDISLHIVLNRSFSVPEMVTMGRLNRILTGSFHSRIFGAARNKGLSYGIYSSTYSGADGITRWDISGQVTDENAVALYTLVTDQLEEVAKSSVTKEELDDVKLYAIGDYQFKGQRVNDLGGWYASDYFDEGIIDHIDDLPKYIENVTTEDISRLVNEFLSNGEWALGVVGSLGETALEEVSERLSSVLKGGVQ